jgi:hypothetical protein
MTPLQGFEGWAEWRSQGVALGYVISPRWGLTSSQKLSPERAPHYSPGHSSGSPSNRIIRALKGRNNQMPL